MTVAHNGIIDQIYCRLKQHFFLDGFDVPTRRKSAGPSEVLSVQLSQPGRSSLPGLLLTIYGGCYWRIFIGQLSEKAFFAKKAKRLDWPAHLVYTFAVEIALSHGVASVAVATCGVSSITAWLTQASDRWADVLREMQNVALWPNPAVAERSP